MKLKAAAALLAACVSPFCATAAETPAAQPDTVKTETQQPDGMLDTIQAAARRLDDNGIRVNLTLVDIFLANPGTGISQNQGSNLGMWGLNTDFDLDKILGWKGATIHQMSTLFSLRSDTSMLANEGSNLGTLDYFKYHVPYAMDLLTLEQKIGPLDVEGGRTNPLRHFWGDNCDDPFSCVPGIVWADTPAMSARYATWGGVVRYDLSPHFYVKGGAFEDDTYNDTTNGFSFGTQHSTGHLEVEELGYTSTFADSQYPGHYELGMFEDSATHLDPLNAKIKEDGPVSIFFEGRQTIWTGERSAEDAGAPPANLGLTWGFLRTTDTTQYFTTEAWFGTSLTGVIPDRPRDHFGLRLHYLGLGGDFARYETLERKLAGGTGTQPENEYAVEASYVAQIAPGVTFIPDFQYVINQDTLYNPHSRVAPADGLVFNADLVISFGALLGTPLPRP